MRKTNVLLTVLVSLLVGCHGENSPTAPPMGATALSGQIVPTADLAGASPAGISVTCSGQVSVTDASGRFAFMSVSSSSRQLSALASGNVNLFFARNDGINSAASVAAGTSDVVVYLQKNSANIVSTGQAKREIEGLITAVSATSITVNGVTAKIDSNTVIRKGNQTLAASDLENGDRVHIKATINSDNSLTAFEIMLQNSASDDTGGGQTRELEGLITAVSSSSITVNNASTGGPVTAAITSSTVIRKGNRNLTASDLHVGDRVHVKTTGSGSSLTATEIMVQNPA